MKLFSIIELISILLLVAYLVYYYAQRKIGIHIKLLAYFSWLISFGFVFLVPLDIFFTFQVNNYSEDNTANYQNQDMPTLRRFLQDLNDGESQDPNDNPVLQGTTELSNYNQIVIFWKLIWWVCFFMTWVILPFFQEYEDAGDFTMVEKIKTSIKNNLILYGLMVFAGILFIVYLAVSGAISDPNQSFGDSLAGFAILMVNCFGLLLVVLLLGHGLVALPKKYWIEKNDQVMLRYQYFQAVTIETDIMEVNYELEDETKILIAIIKNNQSNPHLNHLEQILQTVPECVKKVARESRKTPSVPSGNLELKKIVQINNKIKKILANLEKLESKFEFNLDNALKTEDIIRSHDNPQQIIQGTFWVRRKGAIGGFVDKFEWLWYTKLKKYVYITSFVIFITLSISVLLAELSIFTDFNTSIFASMLHDSDQSYFSTQIVTLIPLSYITFCVYYGLFNMKIKGFFGFYKNQHTDGTSLMFGSINFTRVSAPICYNFLQMISVNGTAFNSVMGEVNLGSLKFVKYIFPILLIILSCFNVFDIYKKILSIFGITQFQFTNDFSDRGIDDGKQIISRARLLKEKQFIEYQQSNKVKSGFNGSGIISSKNEKKNIAQGSSPQNSLNSVLTQHSASNGSSGRSQQDLQNNNQQDQIGNNYGNFNRNKNYDDILNI